MKLSVVIPVYNEKATVIQLVESVLKASYPVYEVIIVDDASTDGTRELLKGVKLPEVCKVYFHERNKGKGAAVKTGFEKVTGEVVLIQDADLEYDPRDYGKLVKPIEEGRAEVVFGSRFMGGRESQKVMALHAYVANMILTFCFNLVSNRRFTDMETCYKVMTVEVMRGLELEEERFGLDPEITAKVVRQGKRIYEVAIDYHPRTYEEGKKIGLRDAFRVFYCIVKYRFF